MSGVLDIDLGWKDLLKELRGLSKKEIKAGIQGGKTKDGTADLVTVAAVQEFGAMIFQHPGEVTVYRKVKKMVVLQIMEDLQKNRKRILVVLIEVWGG